MVAESTIKQYEGRLRILEKAGQGIDNPADLLEWLTEEKLTNSSLKVYLSALKWKYPTNYPQVLQDKLNELYALQNKKAEEQQLTEKQEEKFVAWNDIVDFQKDLRDKPNKKPADWRDYLLVSLYVLNPPVRADYGEMTIHKKYNKKRTGNELIWVEKKPYFVFRNYKTAKTYGEVKIDVSPALKQVIKGWFAIHVEQPKYLMGHEMTPNALSQAIRDVFNRKFGKEVGISLLRHSFITHTYPTLKTLKQKKDLAKKMLHSSSVQETYHLPDKVEEK